MSRVPAKSVLTKRMRRTQRTSTGQTPCRMQTSFPRPSWNCHHDNGHPRAFSRSYLPVGSSVPVGSLSPFTAGLDRQHMRLSLILSSPYRQVQGQGSIPRRRHGPLHEDGSGEGSDEGRLRMCQGRSGSARQMSDSECVKTRCASAWERKIDAPVQISWPKKSIAIADISLWHALNSRGGETLVPWRALGNPNRAFPPRPEAELSPR